MKSLRHYVLFSAVILSQLNASASSVAKQSFLQSYLQGHPVVLRAAERAEKRCSGFYGFSVSGNFKDEPKAVSLLQYLVNTFSNSLFNPEEYVSSYRSKSKVQSSPYQETKGQANALSNQAIRFVESAVFVPGIMDGTPEKKIISGNDLSRFGNYNTGVIFFDPQNGQMVQDLKACLVSYSEFHGELADSLFGKNSSAPNNMKALALANLVENFEEKYGTRKQEIYRNYSETVGSPRQETESGLK